MMMLEPAPFLNNLGALGSSFSVLSAPVLLVSAGSEPTAEFNRYSLATAEPLLRLIQLTPGADFELNTSTPHSFTPTKTFSDAMRQALSVFAPLAPTDHTAIPFTGGALGYLDYETGADTLGIAYHPHEPEHSRPAAWWGLYASVYVVDHAEGQAWISRRPVQPDFQQAADDAYARLKAAVERAASAPLSRDPTATTPEGDWRDDWSPSISAADYAGKIERIHEYLRAGDIYQANLTVRYRREHSSRPHHLFTRLLRENPAPYSAYISDGDWGVISSSPELLLNVDADRRALTRPIKGTVTLPDPSAPPEQIGEATRELSTSPKDRAEHLMIVDLARNDLGRVCEYGSVSVQPLMGIETCTGLAHLASSVTGLLREDVDALDALAAIFPGGSITGAPKLRAMEIIHELEPVPRGLYTGTLGWITPELTARLNLPIRTLTWDNGTIDLQVGGGIVIDSTSDHEYEECRIKGEAMARACRQG